MGIGARRITDIYMRILMVTSLTFRRTTSLTLFDMLSNFLIQILSTGSVIFSLTVQNPRLTKKIWFSLFENPSCQTEPISVSVGLSGFFGFSLTPLTLKIHETLS